MECLAQKTVQMFLKRFLICSLLFILSCNSPTNQLPYYNSPDFNPVFIKNSAQLEKTITHKIEDFAFTETTETGLAPKI